MEKIKAWTIAIRIHTLTAGAAPVIVGLGCAVYIHHSLDLRLAFLTLICTLLMQIGANLANDYFDHLKGIDGQQRIGFTKAVGPLGLKQIQWGFRACFVLALACGIQLSISGGLPILIIGLTAIAFAYLYSAGPYPLSHHALGELTAFIFFGPVAVWGTVYLQGPTDSLLPILVGTGPGYISAAILGINNLRDINSDSQNNKTTIATKYGALTMRAICLLCILFASLVPIASYYLTRRPLLVLATFSPYLFYKTWLHIAKSPIDEHLNISLVRTGQFLFVYSFLFALGLAL